MKHLYIIDQCSSASLYGIGTYIQQIINIWRMDVCSALTIVKLESGTNVIEEGWSDGVRYLCFLLKQRKKRCDMKVTVWI